MAEGPALGTVLWTPPADVRSSSRVGAYLSWLSSTRGLTFPDYASLWQWSVDSLEDFWASLWEYFAVGGSYSSVLTSRSMPGASWFPGASLNYAEYLLRSLPADEVVIVGQSDTRASVTLTGAELRAAVAACRAGLVRLGVGRGDRVAAYLPNIPETVVLLLATASLGAVFSSCAPEFGTRSVVDRWSQIAPKVLVAVDGYRYGDKPVDRTSEVAAIRAALPSLAGVVSVPYLGSGVPDALSWEELLSSPAPMAFELVPFHHPLYVLYSSGTTGLPKAIVHGHGGILLEHLKALALHLDLGPGDRFFWFSTTGWMMWNFLVSGLAVGASIVLADVNPGYPDLGSTWRLASSTGVTFFGTSAPFLLACRKAGVRPADLGDMSRIRGVGSTGAPLPPEGYGWVYENVNSSLLLQSFSGGTDLCTGFIGGSPLLPVYAGELSCRCLGAAVAAYSPAGESVVDSLGELVIERPMPSMPVSFWGDSSGSRYRAAYFGDFPGVWRHGDWITVTSRGTCVITGRSDATLNRGGVRLGTAEFYSVVDTFPEIADSLVVHLEDADGGPGELLLFVVPAAGVTVDDALKARLAAELRRSLSPRHVPDVVVAVPDVPRTLSGKKLEVPVKRILEGRAADEAASRGALANPSSLEAFEKLAAERATDV
ncbi:acetoacetate--CoA ligase [Tenggerimyces flavus]|uniref:Acetoacetate--CoA ligase n=1 Tax=Tenggerimyces flavus TaxID=1708749 RepID=A0ABV7Y2L7_9ACTN|nr:acetoacetate--CoA ligase [Tenggerimyces flavus]MBM7790719.1 acetoacetyl-CoA synthetase [Tenggerimyces flavus]